GNLRPTESASHLSIQRGGRHRHRRRAEQPGAARGAPEAPARARRRPGARGLEHGRRHRCRIPHVGSRM
ncbi:MAG: hypothetical protein, partial [Olavius algarvensis Gamma 1 endosymbiont]